jgi:hypothetical protein
LSALACSWAAAVSSCTRASRAVRRPAAWWALDLVRPRLVAGQLAAPPDLGKVVANLGA